MKGLRDTGAIGAATASTGAALTAAVAGACCVGPALAPIFLTVLGASGLVAVSALRPYTPWLLIASGAMLAFSLWQVYRRPACADDGSVPPISIGNRVARIIIWIAGALWLASSAYSIYGLLNE